MIVQSTQPFDQNQKPSTQPDAQNFDSHLPTSQRQAQPTTSAVENAGAAINGMFADLANSYAAVHGGTAEEAMATLSEGPLDMYNWSKEYTRTFEMAAKDILVQLTESEVGDRLRGPEGDFLTDSPFVGYFKLAASLPRQREEVEAFNQGSTDWLPEEVQAFYQRIGLADLLDQNNLNFSDNNDFFETIDILGDGNNAIELGESLFYAYTRDTDGVANAQLDSVDADTMNQFFSIAEAEFGLGTPEYGDAVAYGLTLVEMPSSDVLTTSEIMAILSSRLMGQSPQQIVDTFDTNGSNVISTTNVQSLLSSFDIKNVAVETEAVGAFNQGAVDWLPVEVLELFESIGIEGLLDHNFLNFSDDANLIETIDVLDGGDSRIQMAEALFFAFDRDIDSVPNVQWASIDASTTEEFFRIAEAEFGLGTPKYAAAVTYVLALVGNQSDELRSKAETLMTQSPQQLVDMLEVNEVGLITNTNIEVLLTNLDDVIVTA